MEEELKVGELASRSGVSVRTLHYYEEVGLLPKPLRSDSGYRLYSNDQRERLQLIKRARLLGLSLAEIKEIVEYAIDGRCGALGQHLLALLEVKLSEVDRKIDQMIIFREDLRRYYDDLSRRSGSKLEEACRPSTPTPCHCIGEDVDSLRK